MDFAREGNLQSLALDWYKQNLDPNANSCGPDFNQEAAAPDYRIIRVEASSSFETPSETPKVDMTAGYLVLKYCFGGATHAGADRSVVDAAVLTADRIGTPNQNDNTLTPLQPDSFKLVRRLNLQLLSVF